LDLIVETQPLTPSVLAALCAAREQPELICDCCLDPDEIVVATMEIAEIDETFALCGACTTQLPRGFHMVD
jgi:hypothetical protein